MKVYLAKAAGFCDGVKRAIELAINIASKSSANIYTDGPLIHNKTVLNELSSKGIIQIDPLNLPADFFKNNKNPILIIRAHGIPPSRFKHISSMPFKIVNATCPVVAKIHTLIQKYRQNNYEILIYGDKDHAEVIGLMGYSEGHGHIINKPEDLLNFSRNLPVCLLSQTTQNYVMYQKITIQAKEYFYNCIILQTICRSTIKRQKELETMAKNVDVIVIAGSPTSANTRRLVEIAQLEGKNVVALEDASHISPSLFKGYSSVFLTSGASTPLKIINEIKEKLEAI